MRVRLEIQTGPAAGRYADIQTGQVLNVGCLERAGLIVRNDPWISSMHFTLECGARECQVRDLKSRLGTRLNGQPVTEAVVRDGDLIGAGQTTFVIRLWDEDREPPNPDGTASASALVAPSMPPVAPSAPAQHPMAARLRAERESLYALLDAARDPRVLQLLARFEGEQQSLYEGQEGAVLSAFAPYLVRLPPGEPLLNWLLAEGWGQSWGVYLTSASPFKEVRKHLRRFLLVKTEEGKELYFRFYDPRVLRVFLPSCTQAELERFFGPVRAFLTEAADARQSHRFAREGEGMIQWA